MTDEPKDQPVDDQPMESQAPFEPVVDETNISSPKFSLNAADLLSIAKGAVINLSGTALVTIGLWLGAPGFDFNKLWIALAANLGAVLVNIGRKFIAGA